MAKVPYFYNILPICRYILLLNDQTWFKNANKHQNCRIKVTISFLWYAGIGHTEPPDLISYHIAILLLLDTVTILDIVTILSLSHDSHNIHYHSFPEKIHYASGDVKSG